MSSKKEFPQTKEVSSSQGTNIKGKARLSISTLNSETEFNEYEYTEQEIEIFALIRDLDKVKYRTNLEVG